MLRRLPSPQFFELPASCRPVGDVVLHSLVCHPFAFGADHGQDREGKNAVEFAELSERTQIAPDMTSIENVVMNGLAKIRSRFDRLTKVARNAGSRPGGGSRGPEIEATAQRRVPATRSRACGNGAKTMASADQSTKKSPNHGTRSRRRDSTNQIRLFLDLSANDFEETPYNV